MFTPAMIESVARFLATDEGKTVFRATRTREMSGGPGLGLPADTANAFALRDVFNVVHDNPAIPEDGWTGLVDFFEWRKICRTVDPAKIAAYLTEVMNDYGWTVADTTDAERATADAARYDMAMDPYAIDHDAVGALYVGSYVHDVAGESAPEGADVSSAYDIQRNGDHTYTVTDGHTRTRVGVDRRSIVDWRGNARDARTYGELFAVAMVERAAELMAESYRAANPGAGAPTAEAQARTVAQWRAKQDADQDAPQTTQDAAATVAGQTVEVTRPHGNHGAPVVMFNADKFGGTVRVTRRENGAGWEVVEGAGWVWFVSEDLTMVTRGNIYTSERHQASPATDAPAAMAVEYARAAAVAVAADVAADYLATGHTDNGGTVVTVTDPDGKQVQQFAYSDDPHNMGKTVEYHRAGWVIDRPHPHYVGTVIVHPVD